MKNSNYWLWGRPEIPKVLIFFLFNIKGGGVFEPFESVILQDKYEENRRDLKKNILINLSKKLICQ